MPGTLIGAFTVDYLGPKWTLVGPFPVQLYHSGCLRCVILDLRPRPPSHYWVYHEWPLRTTLFKNRRLCCKLHLTLAPCDNTHDATIRSSTAYS
jgi:hypothetical protein